MFIINIITSIFFLHICIYIQTKFVDGILLISNRPNRYIRPETMKKKLLSTESRHHNDDDVFIEHIFIQQ